MNLRDSAEKPRMLEPLNTAGAGALFRSAEESRPPEEKKGDWIGRYLLLDKVGEGGFGTVWRAEQREPMVREVALKLIRPGMDSREVINRFEAERQTLALLEHPNIAAVFDGGITDDGRPFFVMELVKGRELTAYCRQENADKKRLILKEKIALFLSVCQAVQHAHQKGVLHRDLKPSNILVTEVGWQVVPKVIDFGIAKAIPCHHAPSFASSLLNTSKDMLVGTPQYMSPEQARGEIETLDARTDIYALGAIFFHILFLRAPVGGSDAMQVVGKVARGEVEWPPVKEMHAVPDSLLAICRKALALEPAARYRSVEALWADILAYQNGFATSAENASAWKQFKLLIKRNKAASIGVAAVLLVGSILGTKALIEGRRAEEALTNLRRSAPVFAEQASSLAAQQKFADALARIDAALAIAPDDAVFHFERANLLQISDRFEEAEDAFARARQLNASLPLLSESIDLNERLVSETAANGEVSTALLTDWLKILQKGNRPGEAMAIARRAKLESSSQLPIWQARLDAWLGKDAPKIKMRDRNLFELELKNLVISDLSPLAGLPIHFLTLVGIPLTDLTPLKDMPLRELRIVSPRLCDLSPLAASKIEHLNIVYCGKVDLRPVRNWPLKTLVSDHTRVSSIEPLRGKKMVEVSLHGGGVSDIEPLRGMPLTKLNLTGNPIASLKPLNGMPLRELHLGIKSLDISPLAGMPLEMLSLGSVVDVTPLLSCSKLRKVRSVREHPSLERLRAHPSLQYISYNFIDRPAAEFWARYDEVNAGKKK